MPRATLKQARQAKGMTQQAVADAVGVGLRHYQQLEYCESNGSVAVWNALEDLLGQPQRKLQEIASSHPAQAKSQLEH